MSTIHSRRHVLQLIGAGAVSLFPASGQDLKTAKLADDLHVITGAGCNVLLLVSAEGTLLCDGGLAENSAPLLKLVNELADGKPVRALFNTHWHPECTGSNAAVKKTGAKVIAHENTRLWMGAEVEQTWQKRVYKPQPKEALPTDTFYAAAKMEFGGETLQYGYLPQAHTDGDIYIYLPKSNVLVAGDVVSAGSYPILDYSTGGWVGGMLQAAKTLLGVANANTKIIPGTGPIQSRADLQAQHDMLAAVYDLLLKLLKQGMSSKDMIAAAPTKEFDAKWGNPELFIRNAYPGLWGHVRELGGIV